MVLSTLELRDFRNLGSQELHFPPEGVAIVGENAQGKTNLLEAIYYLESFRSFRGSADGDLAAFGGPVFHLAGRVRGGKVDSVTAAFDAGRKKKKVTIDGDEVRPIVRGLGHLGAVVFSPADTDLILGGPAKRRRFLDVMLSLNVPGYVDELGRYRKALAQRNAALKAGAGRSEVGAWDESLRDAGARVTRFRHDWVLEWQSAFSDCYRSVSGGGSARVTYVSRVCERGADRELAEGFQGLLDAAWATDVRLRTTTVGPHRDELLIRLDEGSGEISARTHGSGGQRRSAALALRLVEAGTIRASRGVDPLLLLDDAFAELDDRRTDHISALIEGEGTGQVILTSPKESDVRLFGRRLPRWRIAAGTVEA